MNRPKSVENNYTYFVGLCITRIIPRKSRFLPTKAVDNHVENVDFYVYDRVNIHTLYTFFAIAPTHIGTVETIEIIGFCASSVYRFPPRKFA